MSGKNTLVSNGAQIVVTDGWSAGFFRLLIKKLQHKKTCMAFVHMKALDTRVSESAEHSYTADSKERFLAESIMLVAAVEKIG